MNNSLRAFGGTWIAHSLFLITIKIAIFALTFFVYQKTKSITAFSYIALAGVLPNVILLPLLANLVDNYSQKLLIILNTIVLIVSVILIAYATKFHAINILLLCLPFMFASLSVSLQTVIFDKFITCAVTENNYHKAVSLTRSMNMASYLIGPALAGFILFYIDISKFFILIIPVLLISMLYVGFNMPVYRAVNEKNKTQLSLAWFIALIRKQPLVKSLLILFAISFFWMNVISTFFIPILLEEIPAKYAGSFLSITTIGLILGSSLLYVCKIQQKNRWSLLFALFLLFCLAGLALVGSNLLVCGLILFLGNILCGLVQSLNQIIAQKQVDYELQGQFFALRTTLSYVMVCLCYLCIGPLNHHVIKPYLLADSPFAHLLTNLVGHGNPASIKLIFLVSAILWFCVWLISCYLFKRNPVR